VKIVPSVQFYGKLGDVDVSSMDGKMERSSFNSIRLYFVVDHLGVVRFEFVFIILRRRKRRKRRRKRRHMNA
jgi:hypothetical protein